MSGTEEAPRDAVAKTTDCEPGPKPMLFLGEAKGEDGPFGRKSVSVSVRKILECRISEKLTLKLLIVPHSADSFSSRPGCDLPK